MSQLSKSTSKKPSEKCKTSTSSCPYGACNGSGMIHYMQDGLDYAKPCKCREKQILQNKYRFAEMPEQLKDLKLRDYKTDIYESGSNKTLSSQAKKIAVNYVKAFEQMQEKSTGLYFYSNTKGSGKSRLAVGIGNALIDTYGTRVKFTTTTKLLDEIKHTYGGYDIEGMNTSQYLEAIKTVQVLILDDIGTERITGWVNETFYEIINQRMLSKLVTIYTSNCEIDELKHDDRIKSRIKGMVFPVKCPEEDIRTKLRQSDNVEIEKLLLR
ncbi:MAG: ATP-binding protein [Peptoclostridium sp.]|nr:ATP-binding protein [Peptoclostridium sp.]